VTEDTQTSTGQSAAADSLDAPGSSSAQQPSAGGAASVQERAVALANERPEVAAGAAFAGGLLLALILKRLAR
jgi:hypothetical protein